MKGNNNLTIVKYTDTIYILTKTMAFFKWSKRHIFLHCTLFGCSMVSLSVLASENNPEITVRFEPEIAKENSWATLVCDHTELSGDIDLLFWTDGNGDTLYSFKFYKGVTSKEIGPRYKGTFERGKVMNITVEKFQQTARLLVPGFCAKNPYTCTVWKSAKTLSQHVKLKYDPPSNPVLTMNGDTLMQEITVPANDTYEIGCSMTNANASYDIVLELKINDVYQDPIGATATYNNTDCYFSSTVTKKYVLVVNDLMDLKCVVTFQQGEVLIASSRSPEIMKRTDQSGCNSSCVGMIIGILVGCIILIAVIIVITIYMKQSNVLPQDQNKGNSNAANIGKTGTQL